MTQSIISVVNLSVIEQLVETEIFRWYETFYSWSRGLVPKDEEYIRSIYDALAEDFQVVITSGELMLKESYWHRLYNLHNRRYSRPPSNIVNLKINHLYENHVLATYDLLKKGSSEKKVNSALLRYNQQNPAQVMWVYVHESAHTIV